VIVGAARPTSTKPARPALLLELDRSTPIICDRALYRELCKQAIARTAEDLRARVADKGKGKRGAAAARERTPREQLDVEHCASMRELARQAHGTNLDLGAALLTQLATVPADDFDVARFFALCRHPHRPNYADRATMPTRAPGGRSVARRRARLGMIDEFKWSGSAHAYLMYRHACSAGEAGGSSERICTTACRQVRERGERPCALLLPG
jgi:hypothetical protein